MSGDTPESNAPWRNPPERRARFGAFSGGDGGSEAPRSSGNSRGWGMGRRRSPVNNRRYRGHRGGQRGFFRGLPNSPRTSPRDWRSSPAVRISTPPRGWERAPHPSHNVLGRQFQESNALITDGGLSCLGPRRFGDREHPSRNLDLSASVQNRPAALAGSRLQSPKAQAAPESSVSRKSSDGELMRNSGEPFPKDWGWDNEYKSLGDLRNTLSRSVVTRHRDGQKRYHASFQGLSSQVGENEGAGEKSALEPHACSSSGQRMTHDAFDGERNAQNVSPSDRNVPPARFTPRFPHRDVPKFRQFPPRSGTKQKLDPIPLNSNLHGSRNVGKYVPLDRDGKGEVQSSSLNQKSATLGNVRHERSGPLVEPKPGYSSLRWKSGGSDSMSRDFVDKEVRDGTKQGTNEFVPSQRNHVPSSSPEKVNNPVAKEGPVPTTVAGSLELGDADDHCASIPLSPRQSRSLNEVSGARCSEKLSIGLKSEDTVRTGLKLGEDKSGIVESSNRRPPLSMEGELASEETPSQLTERADNVDSQEEMQVDNAVQAGPLKVETPFCGDHSSSEVLPLEGDENSCRATSSGRVRSPLCSDIECENNQSIAQDPFGQSGDTYSDAEKALLAKISAVDAEMKSIRARMDSLKNRGRVYQEKLFEDVRTYRKVREGESSMRSRKFATPSYYFEPRANALSHVLILNHARARAASELLHHLCYNPADGLVVHAFPEESYSPPRRVFFEAIADVVRKRTIKRAQERKLLSREYTKLKRDWLHRLKSNRDKRSKDKRETMKERDRFLLVNTRGATGLSCRTSSGRTSTKVLPHVTSGGLPCNVAEIDSMLADIETAGGTPGTRDIWNRTLAKVPQQNTSLVPFDSNSMLVEDPLAELHNSRLANFWTRQERLIFLVRYLAHPKNFHKIASYLESKCTNDCVRFYFDYKLQYNLKQLLREAPTLKRKGFKELTLLRIVGLPVSEDNLLLCGMDPDGARTLNASPIPYSKDFFCRRKASVLGYLKAVDKFEGFQAEVSETSLTQDERRVLCEALCNYGTNWKLIADVYPVLARSPTSLALCFKRLKSKPDFLECLKKMTPLTASCRSGSESFGVDFVVRSSESYVNRHCISADVSFPKNLQSSTLVERPKAQWTPEECEKVETLFFKCGKDFKEVAKLMVTKTAAQCKGYWKMIAERDNRRREMPPNLSQPCDSQKRDASTAGHFESQPSKRERRE